MLRIYRKWGDFRDLNFTLDLTGYYNKTVADIVDIYFVIKGDLGNADNVLFLKKYTLGQIAINSGTTILDIDVAWPYNEYSQFNKNKEYIAGLFPKFNGDSVADENTDDKFIIAFEDENLINN